MSEDAVKRPFCGSAQIHAEKRGWSMLTGFLGSSKVIITCLSCGQRFVPGQGAPSGCATNVGQSLQGTVARIEAYGAYVALPGDRVGFIHISKLSSEFVRHVKDAVSVGDTVEVEVISGSAFVSAAGAVPLRLVKRLGQVK